MDCIPSVYTQFIRGSMASFFGPASASREDLTFLPSRRQRWDWIPQIASLVRKKRPDARIGAVGIMPEVDIEPVEPLEQVSDTELADLYRRSDVTLLTAREEGFGFPVLESLACGTPVVCGRNSALAEMGGDYVDFVEENASPEAYAEKVLWRLENPPDDDWRRAASEYARSFTWERTARAVMEVYRKAAR